jgi:drug/metabolite transporter (DMT)-like permease
MELVDRLRYIVFGTISAIVLMRIRLQLKGMEQTVILKGLSLGIIGYIGFYLFFSMAVSVSGGVLPSLVSGIMPAMVSLLSNLTKKEILWRKLVVPMVLSGIGLVFL